MYTGRKLTLSEDEVTLPDGRHARVEVVHHPGAVVVLPLTKDGQLVLLKQYRPAVREYLYEFTAGTLSIKEDPLECAKRELKEETGFSAREWNAIGQIIPTPGFCDEIQHLFIASELEPGSTSLDEDEIIATIVISKHEFEGMICKNQIQDAKTLAIYLRAKLLGFV